MSLCTSLSINQAFKCRLVHSVLRLFLLSAVKVAVRTETAERWFYSSMNTSPSPVSQADITTSFVPQRSSPAASRAVSTPLSVRLRRLLKFSSGFYPISACWAILASYQPGRSRSWRCAILMPLFVPERHHRVYRACPTSRDTAGKEGYPG